MTATDTFLSRERMLAELNSMLVAAQKARSNALEAAGMSDGKPNAALAEAAKLKFPLLVGERTIVETLADLVLSPPESDYELQVAYMNLLTIAHEVEPSISWAAENVGATRLTAMKTARALLAHQHGVSPAF